MPRLFFFISEIKMPENTELVQFAPLIQRAINTLAEAKTSAEILDARNAAHTAYAAAREAEHLARVTGAAKEVLVACHEARAQALLIETQAKIRLADEYDAAQARGEVQKQGGDHTSKIPNENFAPTAADVGLTGKDIHEARQLRDAEAKDPGVIAKALDGEIAAGRAPKPATIKKAVKQTLTGQTERADPNILPRSSRQRSAVASKPKPARPVLKRKETATDKVRAYIRDDVAAGNTIGRKDVSTKTGVGEHVVQMADLIERGFQEGYRQAQEEMAAGTVESLALSAQEKLDVHKRRLDRQYEQRVAQLEAEHHHREAAFEQRVREASREALDDRIMPSYYNELDHNRAVAEAVRNGALTARQYTDMLAILSPNNFSETDAPLTWRRATAMFQLINTPVMKDVLVKAEEAPLPPSAFPRNYADLMAMRERVKAERAEQRARRARGTDTPRRRS